MHGLWRPRCALPKGSELAYVEKMHRFFMANPYYEKPTRGGAKVKRRSVMPSATPTSVAANKDIDKLQFSITHYAGKVTYDTALFLQKNTDPLHPELLQLMARSECSYLTTLFAEPAGEKEAEAGGRKKSSMWRVNRLLIGY